MELIDKYFDDCSLHTDQSIYTLFSQQFKNRIVEWTGFVLEVNNNGILLSLDDSSVEKKHKNLFLHILPSKIQQCKDQLNVGTSLTFRAKLISHGLSLTYFRMH